MMSRAPYRLLGPQALAIGLMALSDPCGWEGPRTARAQQTKKAESRPAQTPATPVSSEDEKAIRAADAGIRRRLQ